MCHADICLKIFLSLSFSLTKCPQSTERPTFFLQVEMEIGKAKHHLQRIREHQQLQGKRKASKFLLNTKKCVCLSLCDFGPSQLENRHNYQLISVCVRQKSNFLSVRTLRKMAHELTSELEKQIRRMRLTCATSRFVCSLFCFIFPVNGLSLLRE